MKKLLTIVVGVFAVNLSALAQGTILLQNLWPGGSAPIRDFSGTPIPAGSSQFMVELWAGTSASSLSPLVTTSTWVGGGIFGLGGTEKALTGLAPGSFPFFAIRVWDSTGGLTYDQAIAAGRQYGDSRLPVGKGGGTGGAFQLAASSGGLGNPAGSPPVPAPALIGMQGFQFAAVPEPSTILLGVLSGVAFLV